MGKTEKTAFRDRWGDALNRIFPERQIVVRTDERVSYLRIGKSPQMVIASALIVLSGWVSFSTISFLLTDTIISSKNTQISNARHAYQNLLDEVAEYQRKFISITGDLEENHGLMLELVEQNTTLQQNLSTVEQELRVTEADRLTVISMRERLKGNLNEIQENLHSLTSRNYLLRDDLDAIESDLQLALRERNVALVDGKRLRDYVDDLEGRLSTLQETQISTVDALTVQASDNIAALEKVVSTTGIDIASLLETAISESSGKGGPFIPVPDGLPGDELRKRLVNLDNQLVRLKTLQSAMPNLPLATPLITYYVTSKFGKRQDPVNAKWSMHYGTDMGATNKSSIYSTAPGVITYAGWKGKYGNLVEIDHGNGIKTRYGHLGKFFVKKGQEVGFYEKIGLVGSTGRSTGPHLHYEIVFNNKPVDPMNFVKAGRYVFQE
jgi:murein DD-endopeptidase MepM/ murein hydrolase activator NlpD